MRRTQKPSKTRRKPSARKEVKAFADFQIDWASFIPTLRDYHIQTVDFLSIAGMAPKDFITDSEYRPGHRNRRQRSESYIAKLGSKSYPNESIAEQLVTRLGQIYELDIADSKLRMVDGQMRFMSKYFLDGRSEQLTHGAEIFELSLGKENYAELAENKTESEYFTFQMTGDCIKQAFPGSEKKIVAGFVEMLAFDALIGHNDRHPYNWGIVVPLHKRGSPRFSPIFDTARALFWNVPERRIMQMLNDETQFESYVRKCAPPVGWDDEPAVDFFRLIGLIWNWFGEYRRNIEKLLADNALTLSYEMIDREFAHLMSEDRRELIKRCLHLRQEYLCDSVMTFKGKGEAK